MVSSGNPVAADADSADHALAEHPFEAVRNHQIEYADALAPHPEPESSR